MIAEVGFFSRVGADVRLEVTLLIKGGPASLETERADEFTNSGVFFSNRKSKSNYKMQNKKRQGWITYVDFKVAHQLLNLMEGFAALGCIAGVFAIVEVPNRS